MLGQGAPRPRGIVVGGASLSRAHPLNAELRPNRALSVCRALSAVVRAERARTAACARVPETPNPGILVTCQDVGSIMAHCGLVNPQDRVLAPGRHALFSVNHDGRDSVEIFELKRKEAG